MKDTIRFGGAQIPVTTSLDRNVETLKAAIDWAAENNVDYLVTPEGSLSGYFPDFDSRDGRTFKDVQDAMEKVVTHAAGKEVGLCIGTMWIELEHPAAGFGWERRENQIRYYSKSGVIQGTSSKMYVIPEYDQTVPCEQLQNVTLEAGEHNFLALGLLCNDFWGGPGTGRFALPLAAEPMRSHVIIHASNGFRGIPRYDNLMNEWHNASLRIMSSAIRIPIITVDNCYKMNGDEYDGMTSSESGVLLDGEWLTKVPRTGTQYFYHDFDLDKFIKYQLVDPDSINRNAQY